MKTALPDSTAESASQSVVHALVLLGSVVIIGLTCVLRVRPDQRVEWGSTYVLPETCVTRMTYNFDCPACGLTRSFIYLANGEPYRSLHTNRVGWLVGLAVLLQIPLRIAALTGRAVFLHPLLLWQSLLWLGLAALLVVNWAFKLINI